MKAETILNKYKALVWPRVQKYLLPPEFPDAFKVPKKYESYNQQHWKIVREYPERQGKYLRPTLLLLTAEAMGQKTSMALQTAAGMQLSEEWLLVHDDFEDQSLLRRGKPALQVLYGDKLAVNAGDHLQTIMWNTFFHNYNILGPILAHKIIDEFAIQLARTLLGQTTELMLSCQKSFKTINENDWYFIADGKTAYYTIACPMRLGAIIAGANPRQLDHLAKFGILLGRSFQLIDDLLDVTSDFNGLKEKGNDIYEGKLTLLLGHLIRNCTNNDRIKTLDIIAKPRDRKTRKEVDWVIAKMNQYESISYAKQLADKYHHQARTYFDRNLGFLSKPAARKKLITLIDFINNRKH